MAEISVIIPTHNRLGRLKRVLAAFEQQTYPHSSFEVVVVSDASTDGTNEYLAGLETTFDFHFVIQDHGGPAKTRNTGVAHARAEFILFVDDDVVPAANLIAEHMRVHTECDHDCVVLGPMLTPDDFDMAPWVRWEQAMLMKQYDAMEQGLWAPTARQFYTGNTSLRRQLVVDSGGFDEHFQRAEDVELAYRLNDFNVEFVYNPKAVGYHYAHRQFASWLKIPYTYGKNDIIFATSRGQDWIITAAREEFGYRNALLRNLVRACLNRPRLTQLVLFGLRTTAAASNKIKLEQGVRFSYSGIFSLRYYQGMVDQAGSTDVLFGSNSYASDTPSAVAE